MFLSMVLSPVAYKKSALVEGQGERRRESLHMLGATEGLVRVFLQEVSKERQWRYNFLRANLLKTSEVRKSERCDSRHEPRTDHGPKQPR